MSEHHDHDHHTLERHCDVCVVGGSAAGLATALQLARQRRGVIVVDDGRPRNAPAAHMHGYLGREGDAPTDLIGDGREEVRGYGGEILSGHVEDVTRSDDDLFRVELTGGTCIIARRVVAATGLVDDLPDIEGVADQWGADVIHCPFCHGYEVRDQRVVQIITHPAGLHPSTLLRHLTDHLTLVLHGDVAVDQTEVDRLRAAGVPVRSGPVRRVVTTKGRVAAVELDDGTRLEADAVVVGPTYTVRAAPFASLGLTPTAHPGGLGDVVETDAFGQTSVLGLYAVGNLKDPSHQVLQAAADGSRVGAMISFDLAQTDLLRAARPSAHQADWDHRYGGDQMWSGNPNGSLVAEATGLPPGRALDVGAGEGGDAVWLAEQGWKVTANDISQRALDRVGAEAQRRGLAVETVCADANALDPFEAEAFDLVSAQYASIARTPDDRAVRNLIRAVVPGGTLIMVSHDLEPMRRQADSDEQGMAFDPDAYVRLEDVARILEADPAWELEVHEKRPRPAGAASTHHVDDVVLRARRVVES